MASVGLCVLEDVAGLLGMECHGAPFQAAALPPAILLLSLHWDQTRTVLIDCVEEMMGKARIGLIGVSTVRILKQ